MSKEIKQEFAAAVGRGEFPFDMLRYDNCFPATEAHDSGALVTTDNGLRVVVLKRWRVAGSWTPARWESFGWKLVTKIEHHEPAIGFDTVQEARDAGYQSIGFKNPVKA